MLQSLFYEGTGLHVSGITSIHLQEHKTTVTTTSSKRYTVMLSAAVVDELELNHFQLFHDISRLQYGIRFTRCCTYSCFVPMKWVLVMDETCRADIR